jgi:hypothetical protein
VMSIKKKKAYEITFVHDGDGDPQEIIIEILKEKIRGILLKYGGVVYNEKEFSDYVTGVVCGTDN